MEACALNNMGVAMMVHGYYQDTVTTLKDALCILKMALGDPLAIGREQENPGSSAVFRHDKLKEAYKCVAEMHSQNKRRRKTQPAQHEEVPWLLRTIENNDTPSLLVSATEAAEAALSPAANSKNLHKCLMAILIRETVSDELNSTGGEVESGIILFNYGLACSLLSASLSCSRPVSSPIEVDNKSTSARRSTTVDNSYIATFRATAHNALVLAHAACSKVLPFGENPLQELEVTLLSILALSVAQIFLLQQQNYDCRHASSQPSKSTTAAIQEIEQTLRFLLVEVEEARHFFSSTYIYHVGLTAASAA
ncbi:hypothetical protein ACA910_020486 [Epithemia clementina (nom. ined.)]